MFGREVFNREVRSKTVEIKAEREAVWKILEDIDAYPDWNPFTHKVLSGFSLGDSIELHVRMPKRGDRMQKETICEMRKPDQMAWSMTLGSAFILSARRDQYLKNVGGDKCSYETVDEFTGLLAPLVYHLFAEDIENGFNAMAYALKERAEGSSQ